MAFNVTQGKPDNPEEPTEPNEVRVALSWLFNSDGTLDFEDGAATIDLGGDHLVDINDEENETIAYLPMGASGDIMSGGDSSGADATATYVTLNDESGSLENSSQHANLSGSDLHDPKAHALGTHTASTLSELNALVSDATLDSEGDTRPAEAHALGGSEHNADTLANLNSKISDAVLDGESSTRPPENHDNTAHSAAFISDGDGTPRQIWLIANGASDPSGAGTEDLIFEEQA